MVHRAALSTPMCSVSASVRGPAFPTARRNSSISRVFASLGFLSKAKDAWCNVQCSIWNTIMIMKGCGYRPANRVNASPDGRGRVLRSFLRFCTQTTATKTMNTRDDSARAKKDRPVSLKKYHKRRFAVLLGPVASHGPLRGTAHFEHDQELGNLLRITLDGDSLGSPVIVVREEGFSGIILPDERQGCDHCLRLVDERNDATAYGNTRTRGEG
jgi:hypothetical protein